MSEINVKNGSFLINGKAEIIHAAEFHYFRIPVSEWKSRLQLLKDTGFNTLATYIPWLWHESSEGHFDFDGSTHPMRNLESFLDLATEMGLWIIARPGPYIMAETINEGIPQWVFEQYPEVSVIDQAGHHQPYLSYHHPQADKLIKAWFKAIFTVLDPRQITQGGKIIMVQLDNEIGMIAWVRNMIDLNPDNLERFCDYLRDKGTEVTSSKVVSALSKPSGSEELKIFKSYSHYYRDVIRLYTQRLWTCAKENGMDVLPVINIHGFGDQGRSFPIGLSQLLSAIQIDGMVCATDVYPIHIGEDNFHQLLLVNEMTKALQNKSQALFSIEFEAGGNTDFSGAQSSMTDLHTRLCLSSGMKGINHYLFMDGENFPEISPNKRHDWGHPVRKDGTFRSHYYRYPKLTRMMNAYGQALVLSQPIYETSIGFLIDDYMTEYSCELIKNGNEVLRHFRNAIQFDGIARFLSIAHLNFNAIEVRLQELDPKKIPHLWMMIHDRCPKKVQEKLVEYVKKGGILILMGHIPVKDENDEPCMILKDALSIHSIEKPKEDKLDAFGYTDVPVGLIQSIKGDFDEVFAFSKSKEVIGFKKIIQKGFVLFMGAAVSTNCLDDLDIYQKVSELADLKSSFESFEWIDVRLLKGPLGSLLCLNNYSDDPWMDSLNNKGKTLMGGRPFELPARSGLICPIDLKLNKDLLIKYATVELTQVDEDENRIVLQFSKEGYVKIESNVYQVDENDLVELNQKDLHLKGTMLHLIKKG
jgi:beta-galactosidase